jgi:hypothetical protein
MTQDEFIAKAKGVWGNKFDYSLVNYTKSHHKIVLICPKHGRFRQIAQGHLQGKDCMKCSRERFEPTVASWFNKS